MYTINSRGDDKKIFQFELTTPYDVSTLSLEGTFDVSSVSKIQEKLCLVMMEVKCLSLMIVMIKFMNLT